MICTVSYPGCTRKTKVCLLVHHTSWKIRHPKRRNPCILPRRRAALWPWMDTA